MRYPDWQTRLAAYLAEVRDVPFAYGFNDCALFVAGAVKAMTGDDPARGLRGYRTMAGGQKKLKDAGFADHVALAASLLPTIPLFEAMPGDVVAVKVEGGLALGIVQGRMIYLVTPEGLGLVPRSEAVRAFRV
jgi:hypothetical protein